MPVEWTDPDTFRASVGEEARSADFNKVLDNLAFLYNPPTVTVRLTEAQEVAPDTDALVNWNEATWDTTDDDMWDVGSPGTILIRESGVYLIVCTVMWETVPEDLSSRAIYLERNEQRLTGNRIVAPSAPEHQLTAITSVNADNFFELIVRHLSPGPIELSAMRTRCTVTWLRPPPPEGE